MSAHRQKLNIATIRSPQGFNNLGGGLKAVLIGLSNKLLLLTQESGFYTPSPREKVGMRVLQDKELLTPHLTSPKERKQQLPLQGGWCLKGRRGFNKTSIEPPPAFVGLTMFVNNNSLLLKEGLLREQERRLYA